MMYNIHMDGNDMLDTTYLFQPRGPGTAWLFRMATPKGLIGRVNPRTSKPYRREIRESLNGTRSLVEAKSRLCWTGKGVCQHTLERSDLYVGAYVAPYTFVRISSGYGRF